MSKKRGIVLSAPDKRLAATAKSRGLGVVVDAGLPLAFAKTLFVEPGTCVPWDLLPAAWHFLERWDCAVPLWRYGVVAADVGPAAERKRTQAIVRDLRVLLHAIELLLVHDNEDGRALLAAYREERSGATELRLAFLRAFYRVKPRCCILPRSWLANIQARAVTAARRSRRSRGKRLVQVEIMPGRYVQCHAGDEEQVRALWRGRMKRGRK